ncbi:uncharacterized protein LOC131632586 [Vicia villosa]|uniref:uncharacterized protein LOC131632586 n=1 Tax=Vicia villosa TaxID=3911 RepID=UPI00273C11F0|nr:uncharacterized protein LOC131632586 [Vicia villosa]
MFDPTFDPTRKHHNPKNSFDLYDETRHVTWESANSNNMWPLKQPQFGIDDDETELKPEPRWGMNSPHYRSLSPVSRTEAIIRGQKELMEMVRNMPESNYELSLKDLVEHHHRDVFTTTEENNNNTEDEKKKMTTKKKVDDDKKVPVKRNEKVDHGGFYLKVALPFISLGSNKEKKKKKKESKVSPRPSISDGSVKEKEWWKKSTPLVYKESDDSAAESSIVSNGSLKSSVSSSSKSSSSKSRSSRSRRITSNSSRRENSRGGCWTMFRKSKNQKKRVRD